MPMQARVAICDMSGHLVWGGWTSRGVETRILAGGSNA
jgi:hypothetical protein